MSIRDEIKRCVADSRLTALPPLLPSSPVVRHLFVTNEVLQAADPSTWSSRRLARRHQLLRADLDRFTEGELITVGVNPRDKDATANLARVEPLTAEVWDIRCCDPEEYAQQRATGQVLMTAIHRLTDEQQQVILLKFIDGMDNTEISATMGKREGAVRALQYRALLALQRILQDERYGLERKPREFETIKNGQTHYLRRTTNQESEEELIAV